MNAKQVFDRAAADYDRNRQQLIPRFEDFYGTVIELIPYERDAAFRLLDLGAGTGLLSGLIAAVFPNAALTLADISTPMLAQARERFAHRADVQYRVLDFQHDVIDGEFDVAVSALALHHVEPPDLKGVFVNVYGALAPGGRFINADQTLGTSAANEARYAQAWIDGVRAKGATDADIDAALERMKADRTATLEDQMRWLRDAGFADVDCWFKHYRFAVYSGEKR